MAHSSRYKFDIGDRVRNRYTSDEGRVSNLTLLADGALLVTVAVFIAGLFSREELPRVIPGAQVGQWMVTAKAAAGVNAAGPALRPISSTLPVSPYSPAESDLLLPKIFLWEEFFFMWWKWNMDLPDASALRDRPLPEVLDRIADPYLYVWHRDGDVYLFRQRNWFLEKQHNVPERDLRRWRQHLQTGGHLLGLRREPEAVVFTLATGAPAPPEERVPLERGRPPTSN